MAKKLQDPGFPQGGGMLFALGKIVELLKAKGIATEMEIDAALEAAETGPLAAFVERNDLERYRGEMLFPIRMLRVMNRTWLPGEKSLTQINDFLNLRTHEI